MVASACSSSKRLASLWRFFLSPATTERWRPTTRLNRDETHARWWSSGSISGPIPAVDIARVRMMLFLIIGALAGALLGLRFKVFVLVPLILILACAIIASGDRWKAIAFTILATAVLVQIGYVLGRVCCVWAGRYLRRRKDPRYQPPKSNSASF